MRPATAATDRTRRFLCYLLDEAGWKPDPPTDPDDDLLGALVRSKRMAAVSWTELRDVIRDLTREAVSVTWLVKTFPEFNHPADELAASDA
jgi:hypothetical protein